MQRHPVEPLVALFCQLRSGTEGEIKTEFFGFLCHHHFHLFCKLRSGPEGENKNELCTFPQQPTFYMIAFITIITITCYASCDHGPSEGRNQNKTHQSAEYHKKVANRILRALLGHLFFWAKVTQGGP